MKGCNEMAVQSPVLSKSLGKGFLAWYFISNENILFRLTMISYQKPFFFFCLCLFSNTYPKIKLTTKNLSDLCNFNAIIM